jgi:hypothetical protein
VVLRLFDKVQVTHDNRVHVIRWTPDLQKGLEGSALCTVRSRRQIKILNLERKGTYGVVSGKEPKQLDTTPSSICKASRAYMVRVSEGVVNNSHCPSAPCCEIIVVNRVTGKFFTEGP